MMMIKLDNIKKTYQIGKRELEVLRGVNLHVNKGELVAIMGPSGSGKSTMLNVMGCLDVPTSGSYFIEDKEVSRLNSKELADVRAKKIGFIFQSFNLLHRMSAVANVELGMRFSGGINRKIALEALSIVGLAERANHRPTELSGGEQQRVAIARAIVKKPPFLLADEPTGNLDSKSGAEIINILKTLHAEQKMTMVMITHDRTIAEHCERIIFLKDGVVVEE